MYFVSFVVRFKRQRKRLLGLALVKRRYNAPPSATNGAHGAPARERRGASACGCWDEQSRGAAVVGVGPREQ
jgi:hypothetical protein